MTTKPRATRPGQLQATISSVFDTVLAQRSPQRARQDLAAALAADSRRRFVRNTLIIARAGREAAGARGRRQGRELAFREHDRAITAALDRRVEAALERKRRLTSQGPIRVF